MQTVTITPTADNVTIFSDSGLLWKYMTVVKGKGTRFEKHETTSVKLYWSRSMQEWVSIPA